MSLAYTVIFAGVCAALHLGKLSPALPVLREAFELSLMQSGFLLSLVQLAGMSLGLLVGLLVGGWGLKRSMLSGLLILFAASCWGGFASDVVSLLVLRALEGFGFLLVTLSAPGMIRQAVSPQQLNKTMGFWGAYMPLGTALALLLGPWVIFFFGWSVWWWGLSALTLVMALVIWRTVDSDFVFDATPLMQASTESKNSWKTRTRQALRSKTIWMLALCFFVYSGQWLAVIGFLPVIYTQAGYAAGLMAVLTALVAAVNMVGNIASGLLLSKGVRPPVLLYIGFMAMGLSAALAFADMSFVAENASLGAILRYVGVLMFSMLGGLIPGTLFALAVRLNSENGLISTTVGWMQQWSATGQFFGPPLVAWIAGLYGGWQLTWLVTGACSLAGLVLAKQISKRVGV